MRAEALAREDDARRSASRDDEDDDAFPNKAGWLSLSFFLVFLVFLPFSCLQQSDPKRVRLAEHQEEDDEDRDLDEELPAEGEDDVVSVVIVLDRAVEDEVDDQQQDHDHLSSAPPRTPFDVRASRASRSEICLWRSMPWTVRGL